MKLERGINLGGYLSQCVHSTEHYDAFSQEEDIRKIASMGVDHVRLAIDYEVLEDLKEHIPKPLPHCLQ